MTRKSTYHTTTYPTPCGRPYQKWYLLLGILLSGCTIEGPERLVYLNSGEVVVLKGDTLSSVAARHGVSVRDLAELNALKPPYLLTKIQKLRLPSQGSSYTSQSESIASSPVILKENEDIQWVDVGGGSPSSSFKDSEKPLLIADSDKDADLEEHLTEHTQPPSGWKVTNPSKKRQSETDASSDSRSKKPRSKKTGFCRPVSGKITQKFQKNKKGPHNAGVRFSAPKGTPIRASCDGKVVLSGKLQGDPSKVVILMDHPQQWSTCYKAIDRSCVSENQAVKQGDVIGYSSGPECIFELRNDKRQPVNPEPHFNSSRK